MGVINLGALVEKLKTKLASAGFITSTDYASSTKGGVIKTSSTYATAVSSGVLKSSVKTAEEYESLNDSAFVSKGTLDNVLAGVGGGGLELLGTAESYVFNASTTDALVTVDDWSPYKAVMIIGYDNTRWRGFILFHPAASSNSFVDFGSNQSTMAISASGALSGGPAGTGGFTLTNVSVYGMK